MGWDHLIRTGDYRRALAVARAALQQVRSAAGQPARLVPYLNQVGLSGKECGAFDEAEAAYTEALAIARADDDVEAQVTVLHNLGGLAYARADFACAELWAREGLALRRGRISDDVSGLAADEAALAAILEALGQFDEAEALYRSALRTWRAVDNRYEIAVCLNGLAAVRRFAGHPDDAELLFGEALTAMSAERGESHPQTATVRNNLAMLLHATERTEQALPLLERATADLTSALGADHPATRDVVANRDRIVLVLAMR
jgi:tetratricopeptide (TPR) repeat protein